MILPKEIQDRIAAVRNNNTAGATALAQTAGEILSRVVDLSRSATPAELRSKVIAAGKAIVKAQPAMAPLYCLVNDVLGAMKDSANDQDLGRLIRERARNFSAALGAATDAAAARASSLVTDGSVVFTHSRSSLVEKSLLRAHHLGRRFSVVCTESRPMGEGRELAQSLDSHGIPTTLVIDAAIASIVGRSTMAMVGADALSVHGLVNKIGTQMLAVAARKAGVPLYVVATTHRFLPSTVPLSYQELKNPREIVGDGGGSIAAVNLYFDHTPLEDLAGCVTENAILDRKGLFEALTSWRVQEILDLEACG